MSFRNIARESLNRFFDFFNQSTVTVIYWFNICRKIEEIFFIDQTTSGEFGGGCAQVVCIVGQERTKGLTS